MANVITLLYTENFNNTDTIVVEHDLNTTSLGIQVLVNQEVRQDLISSITVASTNSFTVYLKESTSGAIQIFSGGVYITTRLSEDESASISLSGISTSDPPVKTSTLDAYATSTNLTDHTTNISNPHEVTTTQIGAIPTSAIGSANGVAGLDSGGKIPSGQIPAVALPELHVVADETARLALTVQEGDEAIQLDDGSHWIYDGSDWYERSGSGGGDVTGPGSSTDNAIARFDGTTGKVIQNSEATIDDDGKIEAKLMDISSGPVGATDHVSLTVTQDNGDPFNLGVDTSDRGRVIASTQDATYRQAMVWAADTGTGNNTVFGIATSTDGGSSWNPRFVVKRDGNTGINKNNPSEMLDVNGNIAVSGTVDGVDVSGHASRHENGGADEINVVGLSGELADPQPPKTHASSHGNGGSDELSVAGLSGELSDAQKTTIRKNNGSNIGSRPRINFTEGSNVSLTISDDSGNNEIDITIASSLAEHGNEAHDPDMLTVGGNRSDANVNTLVNGENADDLHLHARRDLSKFYYFEDFPGYQPYWITGLQRVTSGSGSDVDIIDPGLPSGWARLRSGGSNGRFAYLYFGGNDSIKNAACEARFRVYREDESNSYTFIGLQTSTGGLVGFRAINSGNWEAYTEDSGNTDTDSGESTTTAKKLEIIWTIGQVVFKIDGSVVATHTTNIPSGNAEVILYQSTSGGSNTRDTWIDYIECMSDR